MSIIGKKVKVYYAEKYQGIFIGTVLDKIEDNGDTKYLIQVSDDKENDIARVSQGADYAIDIVKPIYILKVYEQ